MKFIHTADLHANKTRKEQIIHILQTAREAAVKDSLIKFMIISGDFWDFTMTATEASGFAEIITEMERLQKVLPVYMIYGTPSHEPAGSLAVFDIMPNISVLSEGLHSIHIAEGLDVTFLAIPEPRLGRIEGDSLEDKYICIQKKYEDLVKLANQKPEGNPLIVIFHGEVEGAVLQNGQKQPAGKSAFPLKLLKELNADYIALGHIHCPQKIEGINAWYPGSPYPKDFGEKHEGSFKIVEI